MNKVYRRLCSSLPVSQNIKNLIKANKEVSTIVTVGGLVGGLSFFLIRSSEDRVRLMVKDSEERFEKTETRMEPLLTNPKGGWKEEFMLLNKARKPTSKSPKSGYIKN